MKLPKGGEDLAMAASGETTGRLCWYLARTDPIVLRLLLQAVPFARAKFEKITVPNKQGLKLVGLLHEGGSKDVVVICHGFRSNKANDISHNLAIALAKEGISTFCLDFSGNGEKEGSFDYANYYGEVDDLHSVVEYFRGENRETRAIIGHSKSGGVVLLYASKYHDVNAV